MTDAASVEAIGPAGASVLSRAGALIVDVRDPADWRSGHAPGSINAPLPDLFRGRVELPAGRRLVVGCANGNDSRLAVLLLTAHGHDAISLKGGWTAWREAGLPFA